MSLRCNVQGAGSVTIPRHTPHLELPSRGTKLREGAVQMRWLKALLPLLLLLLLLLLL